MSAWDQFLLFLFLGNLGETASCPPHTGQMLSLLCKQGRHKASHPTNSLKIGKGLGVYLDLGEKSFSIGAEAKVVELGGVAVCSGAASD